MKTTIKTYLTVIALTVTVAGCGGGAPAGTTNAGNQAVVVVPGTGAQGSLELGAAISTPDDTAAHRFLTLSLIHI